MKTIRQKDDFDCGIAAVAMLICDERRLTRPEAYDLAKEALGTTKRTRIGQLSNALQKLGRPLRSGKMASIPEGGLPMLENDALVRVRFSRNNSLHWMVWDCRRQELLDPESRRPHFSEFHVLNQIEVAE